MAVAGDGTVYVLGVSGGTILGGPVHRISPSGGVASSFIQGSFYAIDIDGASELIYLADAMNFVADGEVSIMRMDGTLVKRFTVQRGPGSFAFRR
jgi:hypothetical protein